jgi:DNA replication protein DnaC
MKSTTIEKRQLRWKNKVEPKRVKQYFSRRIQKILTLESITGSTTIAKSTYIAGIVNCGKTIRACKMLLAQMHADYLKNTLHTYCFISLDDLLLEIRAVYCTSSVSDWDIIKKYSNFDYLVIDDIGTQSMSDWVYQTIYTLINNRYEDCKKTVYTSNLSIDSLVDALDDERIPRRIKADSKTLNLS